MSQDINAVLARIPQDKRVPVSVCEALDKVIRDGADINQLQRDTIFTVVKSCVEANDLPPPLLESFCAYAYTEWTEEAKMSETEKKNLVGLVKLLKTSAPLAGSVGKLAHEVVHKREARKEMIKRMAEKMVNAATPQDAARKSQANEPSKVYVRKMQEARLGTGGNPVANINLAIQIAEEAIDVYPSNPLVLFEAAGCYQLFAEKTTRMSITERYVNLRQALTLYQRCYESLTTKPYSELKEHDKWRSGTAALIVKLQKEVDVLQEKQERGR